MSHDHSHPHDHDKTFQPDHPEPTGAGARVGLALRELLLEQGRYTVDEERAVIDFMQSASPHNGGRLVARAWTDPAFYDRLMSDGANTIKEMGFDLSPTEFTVVENTDQVHNVIVCTLCSCYPRALLGMSPAWYRSKSYRSRVVREPREVLKEFGTEIDNDMEVRVHDSTAELRYMVLPQRPAGTEGWNEERLAGLVTRDSLIGVQRELPLSD